jgi:hypothetical protein
MDQPETVTVFNFRIVDGGEFAVAPFKATRGTEQVVDRDELDRHGRYRRIATGWGELL